MNWCWIDRFVEFESGRYAQAVKNISLADRYVRDHFPAYPMMPESLVIEGLAQTGGLLVFEHGGFSQRVVLAKIPQVEFYSQALPGDTLIYTATLEFRNANGAMVTATSHKGKQLQAEAEIMFAHLDDKVLGAAAFDRRIFLRMMKALRAFDVGHAADGSRLVEPPPLLRRIPAPVAPAELLVPLGPKTQEVGPQPMEDREPELLRENANVHGLMPTRSPDSCRRATQSTTGFIRTSSENRSPGG